MNTRKNAVRRRNPHQSAIGTILRKHGTPRKSSLLREMTLYVISACQTAKGRGAAAYRKSEMQKYKAALEFGDPLSPE